MTTNRQPLSEIIIRLNDLKEQSERWHKHTESNFLNEEEIAEAKMLFQESDHIVYDGGYPEARKKKVIFRYDSEDEVRDIVCIKAIINQKFRSIGHRDVLGALMHLQIDRSSFGDFWIDGKYLYIYTSEQMSRFICENLLKIANISVDFTVTDEHPSQVFCTREFEQVIASPRADAIVAALAHCSRANAKEMIKQGKVQFNHRLLEAPDELCNNGTTISIRGSGRYTFRGILNKTKKDRIVAGFSQDIQRKEA